MLLETNIGGAGAGTEVYDDSENVEVLSDVIYYVKSVPEDVLIGIL